MWYDKFWQLEKNVVFTIIFLYFYIKPQADLESNIMRPRKVSQHKIFLRSATATFMKISHFMLTVATYPGSQQKANTFVSYIAFQLH